MAEARGAERCSLTNFTHIRQTRRQRYPERATTVAVMTPSWGQRGRKRAALTRASCRHIPASRVYSLTAKVRTQWHARLPLAPPPTRPPAHLSHSCAAKKTAGSCSRFSPNRIVVKARLNPRNPVNLSRPLPHLEVVGLLLLLARSLPLIPSLIYTMV